VAEALCHRAPQDRGSQSSDHESRRAGRRIAEAGGGCNEGVAETAVGSRDRGQGLPGDPSSITVKTGMITGEVIELKVTERVDKGSGRVVSRRRLTGKLRLENTSGESNGSLVEGKLLFMDAHGQRIQLDAALHRSDRQVHRLRQRAARPRTGCEPGPGRGVSGRGARANRLKEIRLELAYVASPFREETVNFVVSIGVGT